MYAFQDEGAKDMWKRKLPSEPCQRGHFAWVTMSSGKQCCSECRRLREKARPKQKRKNSYIQRLLDGLGKYQERDPEEWMHAGIVGSYSDDFREIAICELVGAK